MAAYLGTKEIDRCYLGTKELDVSYLGTTEVCSKVDDGKVHFPYTGEYYIQAFKGTGRIKGKTRVLQLNTFALRHTDGTYVLNKYHLQYSSRNEYISLNVDGPAGFIHYVSELSESGYQDESASEIDFYDRSTTPYTYIGTVEFEDWNNSPQYQQAHLTSSPARWSRVNEFHPERASNKFRMEIYTAHSFSDTYKLYFPKMWFRDMDGVSFSVDGVDAYSTPQDSGSTTQNIFDGKVDTLYNSVNTSKMIVICFQTRDRQPRTLGQCGIMTAKEAYNQTPATFRISACDDDYKPLWEMAMVKEPLWNMRFAYKEWDTKVWPARLIRTMSL